MRLSREQRETIVSAVHRRDPWAEIRLFGSRVDDLAKGGDIDILVLSSRLGFDDLWPIRRDILDRIGWQKLDIILADPAHPQSPIVRLALETGSRL